MRFIVILLIGIMFLGCARNADKNEVIGAYRLNVSDGSNTIELYPTGMYQHKYRSYEGEDVIINDSWTFEIVEGRTTVVLHNFKSSIVGVSNATGNGYFLLMARTSDNTCRLWIDCYGGRDIYFEKIKPSRP